MTLTPEDIDALAKRIHDDAHLRRIAFQWFLFLLPLFWGVTYGILWAILVAATR